MENEQKTGDRAMATTLNNNTLITLIKELQFKIAVLHKQAAACMREIYRNIKKYIDRLVIIDGQLEELTEQLANAVETAQLTTTTTKKPMNTTTNMIEQMISIGAEELIKRDVEKNVEQNGDFNDEQEKLEKIKSIVARKVATLSKPKEAKGMARIMNHVRIREEDLNDLRVNNVSWESFYKLLCSLRGDHFDYLD